MVEVEKGKLFWVDWIVMSNLNVKLDAMPDSDIYIYPFFVSEYADP